MSRGTTGSNGIWGPRIVGALVLWVLLGGALASSAWAGTYTVESCTSAAQAGIAGWVPSTVGEYTYANADCAAGGPFQGYFTGRVEHSAGHAATYTFESPAHTTIGSIRALRTAVAGSYRDYGNPVAMLQVDGVIAEECQQFKGCSSLPEGPVQFGFNGAHSISFGAYCAGALGCPVGTTAYRLRQVRLGLSDVDDPTFTSTPSGSLTSSAANLPAVRTLTYSAADQGGGVYRHRLLVDGAPVVSETVNTNGGKCATPFRDPVPCRTSPTNASITFDTGVLSNGLHTLQLEVRDATDDNKVVTAPWAITVGPGGEFSGATPGGSASPTTTSTPGDARDLNTIAPVHNPMIDKVGNGTPVTADALLAARFVVGSGSRARSSTRVVAAYRQHVRVRGTLTTPGGRPIVGATVYLVQKAMGPTQRGWRIGKAAATGGDGGFELPVEAGGRSRDIRVVYFPMGGSDANRGSNPLILQVRQDADFQVSRRLLHNGGRLVFGGRVLGTIPTTGVDVRVQVRLNRSWFTFAKLRTSRSRGGRFQTAHRFTKTTRVTTYRFRILVLPRNRTLNSTGFSRHLDVRVLP
ncbi:MAG: hypothetical protein JWN65_74 [Solirubrobacterales bacterium]|nr:hypothetical protein [Solirubrobacterales bacterium]